MNAKNFLLTYNIKLSSLYYNICILTIIESGMWNFKIDIGFKYATTWQKFQAYTLETVLKIEMRFLFIRQIGFFMQYKIDFFRLKKKIKFNVSFVMMKGYLENISNVYICIFKYYSIHKT